MNKFVYMCLIGLLTVSSFCEAQVQRVRITFESPTGYVRPLLLGFDPDNNATDGVDPGWDTLNFDDIPGDLNFLIEGDRYVVQGVGAYDETKVYPFGLYLTYSGTFNIFLEALENFDPAIEVFIYDAYEDTYTCINEDVYSSYMLSGEYTDRYFIAFTQPEVSLSTNEYEIDSPKIVYLRDSREILINARQMSSSIQEVSIFNVLGQKLALWNEINALETTVPLYDIGTGVILVKVRTESRTYTKKISVH